MMKLIKEHMLERNILKVLEGDCETAVGAHAVIKEKILSLKQNFFL